MKHIALISAMALLCTATTLLCMEEEDDDEAVKKIREKIIQEAINPNREDQRRGAKFRLLREQYQKDPDKIFIRALPNGKQETKNDIIAKLLKLSNGIIVDKKKGTIIIEGRFIEAFVLNQSLKQMERKKQLEEEQKKIALQKIQRIKTRINFLMKADPHAVTIQRGTAVELELSNDQKDQLFKALRSLIHAIIEDPGFGPNTKTFIIDLDQLEEMPHFKAQEEKAEIKPSKAKKLTVLQNLATPAKVIGYTLGCVVLGYLLAQWSEKNLVPGE